MCLSEKVAVLAARRSETTVVHVIATLQDKTPCIVFPLRHTMLHAALVTGKMSAFRPARKPESFARLRGHWQS